MEAVPRMPMIWLDLKEAGEFAFNGAVKKFVLKNYGENPENYNEELRKLELLRQSAVNVPRDFEGCSTLRKYFGQLHYLQSRIPMGAEQEAAVPIAWTEIFSGKTVTHEDIKYEQACILYNLGALHSMLGAMDKRVSEEGMKVSCTHFQCAAGAFTYLRDHFPHSYSVDMSHQILNLNINLMLGQAQECLLEKSMLDNRKSFLVARISAQVVDYYKEACRALENTETASLLGKIQKDWKKLVQMKIYYFAAVAHLHMGKQAEEQQKFGERVIYFQSALDKLNEAIKLAKGQPETVQEALRFTMDVIGGKYNSAKKDNDFIYHEAVPALDTLQAVKGAPLVKALPVNPTDPAVTGPDIFAKLVPMAAHEASSLYSEEKAKLLRDVMAKIEAKNEVLDQFMDSMQLDPETVDNLEMYDHIPSILMEKCAALSVRPDTVKNLVQSMQVLSGVFTDVEASLKEIRDLLEEDEAEERKLQELLGKIPPGQGSPPPPPSPSPALAEVSKECSKYLEVHEKASFTNTELHKAMNLHIGNLRLLSGPLEEVRAALPSPSLTEDDKQVLQNLKRILAKVQEMRDQRMSLEQQLREMIQKDDITTSLVTTDRSEMKNLFEEQLKKYDQLKVYLEQNLAAQENILKALTDANVKYAAVRKALAEVEHKWNTTVQTLVASYEAYEDLMKKSQEGKDFYTDLEGKATKLLEKARSACQAAEATRQQILEKELKKPPPPRPTAPKPSLPPKPSQSEAALPDSTDLPPLASLVLPELPEELRPLPTDLFSAPHSRLPPPLSAVAAAFRPPEPFVALPVPPFAASRFPASPPLPSPYLPPPLVPPSAPQPPSLPPAALFPPAPTHPGASPPFAAAVAPPPPQNMAAPLHPPPIGARLVAESSPRPPTTTTAADSIPAPIPTGPAPPPAFLAAPPPPRPPFPFGRTALPPFAQVPPRHFAFGGAAAPLRRGVELPAHTQPFLAAPFLAPARAALPFQPQFPQQGFTPPLYHLPAQDKAMPPAVSVSFPAAPGGAAVSGNSPALPFGAAAAVLSPTPTNPNAPHRLPPSANSALNQIAGAVVVHGALVPSPAPPTPGAMAQRAAASAPSEPSFQRQSSSTDDLLSSSPESHHGGSAVAVGQPLLQPTKADGADLGSKSKAVRLIEKDPYEKPERILRLSEEVERFRAVVESLEGPGELDVVWKELQEAQDRDARQLSIAVARCYSLKNRHQEIMPYDRNRVVLSSGKDDYINASMVEELSAYCPPFIATQAPLAGTAADFWLMIYEQKAAVVVMLVAEQEVEKKVLRYFPSERGQTMVQGPISLVLTSLKVTPTHVERMITLQYRQQSLKRTVVHLQFTSWPELGLPDTKDALLRFIHDVHGHYLHQRPLHTPIVVHCSSGVGRTGAFCLLYAAVQEVEAGNALPDLPLLVRRLRQQRKHMLHEKLHLKLCFEALLLAAEQVLQRHGVAVTVTGAAATAPKAPTKDAQDLVLGGDVPISSIQATIAKLSVKPASGAAEPATLQPLPTPDPTEATSALPDGAVDGVGIPEPSPPPPEPPGDDAVSSAGVMETPEVAPALPTAPSSSSLELLASLTPEAFTLDASLKGKQRMNKQNFLQAQTGEGLRGPRPSDDPLSLLDPLWTLNKT
ncbi:tyrosine-protein phosphatase non-receptor type 23 isoform X2 [Cuculus canorus]|uniref:tyrosine-protein phosphatase non-receptor type 23 isoform X2 n=1 Tax=Cuculus canorus TaxID=55661 RepID=UPI0023AAD102|nr:tyrosine-protein phosphatase non-receptor type 23 isoform X2 [Cuculus canorus]